MTMMIKMTMMMIIVMIVYTWKYLPSMLMDELLAMASVQVATLPSPQDL